MTDKPEKLEQADRRKFLEAAGKFAVVVPPAMTFLLSTTMTSDAIASSCNRGIGIPSGGEHCDPGESGGNPGNAGDPNEQNNGQGGNGGNGGNGNGQGGNGRQGNAARNDDNRRGGNRNGDRTNRY